VCWNLSHRSDRLDLSKSLSYPLARFQRLWPDISSPHPGHVWPNLIPQWLSPRPDIFGSKPGSREGGWICPAPDPDMSEFLTPQRLVFQILYKRLSTPSHGELVPDHLHNLLTASWAIPNLSLWDLSLRCKILELGGEIYVVSTNSKPWALWAASSTHEAFVTLGGKAS
jgi:hypothetical protein